MIAVRRLPWPLRLLLLLLVAGLVVMGVQLLGGGSTYHVRLRDAAGIKAGDDVRVAGLKVGKVTGVSADRDQVDVAFTLDDSPAADDVTTDSRAEVKLFSILGQRFLSLTPGTGAPLADGGTIAVSHAIGTYPMDRFWLDSVPQVERLDLPTIQHAVGVLSRSMSVDPASLHRALAGISGVARMVRTHQGQLDTLLAATHQVTRMVLGQTRHVDTVLAKGGQVLTTVYQRRVLLSELLREAHRFVAGLSAVVRASAPRLEPGLRDMRLVLRTLDTHRRDLDRTLRLAGPTLRVFTNAAGDGPWLGVNAPYAIFPDNTVCSLLPEKCS